ncbi:hypothetical protein DITRI_Ditri09bG0151300 [Diplodiscus trichospermus]
MVVPSLRSLPIGYRFLPTDKEVIDYYLRSKINGEDNDDLKAISEVDICKFEPWDLPDLSAIKTCYQEWFFFCPLDRKYSKGKRHNRATKVGYWKPTGKDRKIKSRSKLIGMKRSLVFYTGQAGRDENRTNWVMHEYRTTLKELDGTKPGQNVYVICRLFKKQDKTKINEDRNRDKAGPSASSSAKDMQHELEVPQNSHIATAGEEVAPSNETCPVILQNEVIGDIVPPISECNNNKYEPYGDDNTISQVDLQIEPEVAPSMFDNAGNTSSGMEFEHNINIDLTDFDPNFALEQVGTGTANKQDVNVSSTRASYNVLNINGESSNHVNKTFNVDGGGSCNESYAEAAQVQNCTMEQLGINATAQDCIIPIHGQGANFSGAEVFYNVLNSHGQLSNHVHIAFNVDHAGGSCNGSYAEAAQVPNCTLQQLGIQATAQECAIPIHWQQYVNFSGTDVFYNELNSYGQLRNHVNQTFNVDHAGGSCHESYAEMNNGNFPFYNNNYKPYGLTDQVAETTPVENEFAPLMFDHVGNNSSGIEFQHVTNENSVYNSHFSNSILGTLNGGSDDIGNQISLTESETPMAMAFGEDRGSFSEYEDLAQLLLGPVNGNPQEINATAQDCTVPTCNQDANFSGSESFYNDNGNLSNHVNSSCDADTSTTGIVIRSRPNRSQPDTEKSLTQDINVPARLRLQRKAEVPLGNDTACACGNMEEACACEVVPSRGLKKFSAHCSLKPFAVMFVVAVMLILLIVLVSKMHAM